MSEAEVPKGFPCTHGSCWSGRRHVSVFFLPCQSFTEATRKMGLLDFWMQILGFESTLQTPPGTTASTGTSFETNGARASPSGFPKPVFVGRPDDLFCNDLPAGRQKDTMALIDVKQEHTGEG